MAGPSGDLLVLPGLAVDAPSNVHVTGLALHRVQQLSPAGDVLAEWATRGDDPGTFNAPVTVPINRRCSLYVAELGNHRDPKLALASRPRAYSPLNRSA